MTPAAREMVEAFARSSDKSTRIAAQRRLMEDECEWHDETPC